MSKIFYDHLIVIEDVDERIDKLGLSPEHRQEIYQLIDEMIHHRILGCVLDRLPRQHHQKFLERFHTAPHDESHLGWLEERIEDDVKMLIKKEIKKLKKEILEDIKGSKTR